MKENYFLAGEVSIAKWGTGKYGAHNNCGMGGVSTVSGIQRPPGAEKREKILY
jgi:hypothetical protein